MQEIIVSIHVLVLVYIAWNIFRADHMGYNWMSGKLQTLDENTIKKYHHASWAGLCLMILTGAILFYPMREYLLTRPQFFVKMGFVAALIINGIAIGKLSKTPTTKTFASLTTKEKIPFFISGAVSTISWLGALMMAFFLEQE